MKIETIDLEKEFQGKGEVKGYNFSQVMSNDWAYLYKVKNSEDEGIHYEVFKRKESHLYDFENKTSLEGKKVRYPNSNSFGEWAWTTSNYKRAVKILEELTILGLNKDLENK